MRRRHPSLRRSFTRKQPLPWHFVEVGEAGEDGDRRACVRLGILIGENRERRAAWRREHPDAFFYER